MTEPLPSVPPPPVEHPTPSWTRRHRTPLIVGVGAVVAIGVGVGIGAAAAANQPTTGNPQALTSPAAPASTPSTGSAAPKSKGHHGTRGTIVSESGTRWTVHTMSGRTLTVTITPQTKFGTKKAPATAAQFTPGKAVVIAGTVSNDAVTATRIAAPAHAPAHPTPSSSATTS